MGGIESGEGFEWEKLHLKVCKVKPNLVYMGECSGHTCSSEEGINIGKAILPLVFMPCFLTPACPLIPARKSGTRFRNFFLCHFDKSVLNPLAALIHPS